MNVVEWFRCDVTVSFAYCFPLPESSTYSDSASRPAPFSSSPSRKPWETRPACQSRAAWGKMGVSWRQTALRPCALAPPSDTAPPSLWCPPTSHRNQKLTLCLKPSYPSTEVQIHATTGEPRRRRLVLTRTRTWQTWKETTTHTLSALGKDVDNCKRVGTAQVRTFRHCRASRIHDALSWRGQPSSPKNHVEDQ